MDYTDEQYFLQCLQKGETAAFECLREKSYGKIASIAESISKRKEDADDFYQDAILTFLYKINKSDFVLKSEVRTFLIGICKLKKKEVLKTKGSNHKYMDELPDHGYDTYHDENMDQSLYGRIYRKGFKKLKEDCQSILKKFYDKIGYKKIAEDMGLTPMYVKEKKSL